MRIVCLLLALFLNNIAFAALSSTSETLFKPDISCSRSFIYKNRVYPLDSNRKQDGEGFRFLARNNAESEKLLNNYQANRRFANWTAYTGTLGALILVGGNIYAEQIKTDPGRRDTQYTVTISGAFLILSSYVISQYAIHRNEKNLEKAIETYNVSVQSPEKIRVGLEPLQNDKGAAVKGQMSF